MLDYRDYPELSAEFAARHPIDDPRFEPWLEAWYGGTVTGWGPGYHPKERAAHLDLETSTLFTVRAWMMGKELTRRFSEDQIGQAVWALHHDIDWSIPWEHGERIVWDAVGVLYREVFEPLVNDERAFAPFERGQRYPLNDALFMFWDAAAWHSRSSTPFARAAFLNLCRWCLDSPKAAIQRSALHGLGENTQWGSPTEGALPEAAELATWFADHGRTPREELRDYADQAATGMIQ